MSTPASSVSSDSAGLPFTLEERAEIQHYVTRYRAQHGHGSVTIQLNFNDGRLPVVVVNGRRFERPEEMPKRSPA